MSGHSKWSTIKRAKGAADAKRGAMFNKLAKKISVAAREGNSGDPAFNFRLRVEIEKARAISMPNDNIERAIKKGLGVGGGAMIEEVVYEGYGPYGTAFIIEAATDNKNRTVGNIKHTLSKNGGSLGAQGSVAWQFITRGQILIERVQKDMSEIILAAIDGGAEDVQESEEGLVIYTAPEQLQVVKQSLLDDDIVISQSDLVQESTQPIKLSEAQKDTVQAIIDALENDEDVISVHSNIT